MLPLGAFEAFCPGSPLGPFTLALLYTDTLAARHRPQARQIRPRSTWSRREPLVPVAFFRHLVPLAPFLTRMSSVGRRPPSSGPRERPDPHSMSPTRALSCRRTSFVRTRWHNSRVQWVACLPLLIDCSAAPRLL